MASQLVLPSPHPVISTATASGKKPYKELTLEEKVQLIRLAECNPHLSQASIAEHYEIAKSNVCRILQRKSEYLSAYESDVFSAHRKRKLRPDKVSVTIKKAAVVTAAAVASGDANSTTCGLALDVSDNVYEDTEEGIEGRPGNHCITFYLLPIADHSLENNFGYF